MSSSLELRHWRRRLAGLNPLFTSLLFLIANNLLAVVCSMGSAATRGFAAVLADILNWLRIYKQRAFWVQIGATISAVLLWAPFVAGLPTVSSLVNLVVTMALLCSILTNIVWAGLRKSYSCVIGTIIGFGLFYGTWR